MLPNPPSQLEQMLGRADAEARVARRARLVRADGDVDLLARVRDVEPGQVVRAVRGHGARRQAQRAAVEGCGVGEGARGDEEVDVGEGGDHDDGDDDDACFGLREVSGCGEKVI